MLSARTVLIVFLVGPAATLLSLQAVMVVSSRVNDPRTAQQVGALVILPLSGLFVAQFVWSSWLSTAVLGVIGTVVPRAVGAAPRCQCAALPPRNHSHQVALSRESCLTAPDG